MATPTAELRRVVRARAKIDTARRAFEDAVVAAAEAGASYSQIGDALGLSKQRIGEIVKAAQERPTV